MLLIFVYRLHAAGLVGLEGLDGLVGPDCLWDRDGLVGLDCLWDLDGLASRSRLPMGPRWPRYASGHSSLFKDSRLF